MRPKREVLKGRHSRLPSLGYTDTRLTLTLFSTIEAECLFVQLGRWYLYHLPGAVPILFGNECQVVTITTQTNDSTCTYMMSYMHPSERSLDPHARSTHQ